MSGGGGVGGSRSVASGTLRHAALLIYSQAGGFMQSHQTILLKMDEWLKEILAKKQQTKDNPNSVSAGEHSG